MTTHILDVPPVAITCITGTNEDWLDGIAYQDNEQPPNDVPLDGINFEMMLRHATPEATAALHCTLDNGMLIQESNIIRMNVPAEVMAGVPPTDYVFDVVGNADGYTRRILIGELTVVQGVTRFGDIAGPAVGDGTP